ncbi:lysine--tRNA ligase [Candidatus Peregrinibacteria bacterium]|nr:MAG: lysine--tRNA ligase [Candidatus Peregrinibacteria bacterium]
MHEDRLNKLNRMKEMGLMAYQGRFDRTHTLAEAKSLGEKGVRELEQIEKAPQATIQLCGRIMTLREHGKLTFAQLQDQSGRLQICFKKGFTDDPSVDLIKLLDLGDFVGLTGELFRTNHGEITLLITEARVLSKSLRPLPEKWHGLKDRESCYRQRYLDLVMNEDTKKRFLFRSELIRLMRQFYHEHGFVEIETPVLENISSGATAKPFTTHHNALDMEMYLRIAAGELWQKIAMVGGLEKTFEVAKVFRNEGIDPSHLQEFTMVEHYAAYWDYEKNMEFTEQMFEYIFKTLLGTTKVRIQNPEGKEEDVDFKAPWPRVKFYDLIKKDCGIDPAEFKGSANDLRAAIKTKGIHIEEMETMGFGSLVDHLYKKVSRPKLVQPTFVTTHPVDMKPLARKNDDDATVCDTFQLLVNGWEVINAYSEIVDPIDQRQRFEVQATAKAGGDEEAMSMNEDYLRAMEHGMPPVSGWGMGIDRLVTLLTQQDNLKDVVLFPMMRPQATKERKSVEAEEGATTSSRLTGSDDLNVELGIDYAQAKKLFEEHVKNPAIQAHSLESEAVMRALAKRFGANEEVWGILGLLHDIDWDPEKGDVCNHGIHSEEILRAGGMSDEGITVIKSHVYGFKGHNHPFEQLERTRFIEHALAAGETVTGLIHAAALVRPSKSVMDMEASSLKKKFKDKGFAAGVDRTVVQECEKLGLEVSEFLELALNAIKAVAPAVGI